MDPAVTIRDLASHADYAACVELQRVTWGSDFTECVPPAILQVARKIGGIAAGAFAGDTLVGFVFGLTGVEHGRIVHWSDMLAVRPSHRNQGIGERLKWYQREALLARGIDRVYWTFDPLDARNAHINFNRLGVYAREYVVDMYGNTASPLHRGIGTDRLIAVWELSSPRVVQRLDGTPSREGRGEVRVEIPADIHAINAVDPTRAREWRARTRKEFMSYLPGHVVSGFTREGDRGFYELTPSSCFDA